MKKIFFLLTALLLFLNPVFAINWLDINYLPQGKGMNNYSLYGWYENPIYKPTDEGKISHPSQIKEGQTYYGCWVGLGSNHKIDYYTNTNKDVIGLTYHHFEEYYSSYYFINENDELSFYSYYKVTSEIPTATDGTFIGWSDSKDSNVVTHQAGDVFDDYYGNMTFYAVWEVKEVSLFIDLKDGQIDGKDYLEIKGNPREKISLSNPTLQGYSFKAYLHEEGLTNEGKLDFITVDRVRQYTYTFGYDDDYIYATYDINTYKFVVNLNQSVSTFINIKMTILVDGVEKNSVNKDSYNVHYLSVDALYNSDIQVNVEIKKDNYSLSFDNYSDKESKIITYQTLLNDNITIDKGEKDGIQVDMPVIVADGLIGKVVKTSTFNSTIRLLTANNSNDKISVKIKNEDNYIYGILSKYNEKNNNYIIEGITQNIEIKQDALVTTTGMGDIYPSGIIIGKVKGITTDNFDLSKVLEIESNVNFDAINYVKVLKRGDL